jgi:alpha-1,3-mannosyltransferase
MRNSHSPRSLVVRWYKGLAEEPIFDTIFLAVLVAFEIALGLAIVCHVSYTEIDWQAYMQQVQIWLDGELDYRKIRGGTGPLVYPAGFLILFAAFRRLTHNGTDVRKAQYIFLAVYIATQCVVWMIYHQQISWIRRNKQPDIRGTPNLSFSHHIWSWRLAMLVTCFSKRVHSIFLLRLFNEGPTMLLLYISCFLFMKHKWNVGCVVFSLAVSVKMNVLLFAPGLLLLLLQVSPDLKTVVVRLLTYCALPQLILGAPFLVSFPASYLRKAFELDRVFFYEWTVNWKVR